MPLNERSQTSRQRRAMNSVGITLSRSTLIYAVALGAVVPFGIASVAVSTRYLTPTEFGQLAILLTIASGLTVIGSLGALQGSMMLVYGAAGEEDGDVDVDELLGGHLERSSADKRRIMGLGFVLTAVLGSAVGAVIVLVSAPLAALFLNDSGYAGLVRWACVCGVVGGMWRFVLQAFRYERRPAMFAAASTLRPLLVVGLTVLALADGRGVAGVLQATAAGTLVSVGLALLISRTAYSWAIRPAYVRPILVAGGRYMPVMGALFIHQNADVVVLSQAASVRDVGLYRLATRIAQMPSYISYAYLMVWPTLENTASARAAREESTPENYQSTLFTYLVILTVAVVVVTSVGASALIQIAAPSYARAADYLPLAAAASGAYVIYYGMYRAVRFPRRITWFSVTTLAVGALYSVGAVALLDPVGVYAVPGCAVVAALLATVMFRRRDVRAGNAMPLEGVRLAAAFTVAVVMLAIARVLPDDPWIAAGSAVGLSVGFAAGLVVFGVVPASRVGDLLSIARRTIWQPKRARVTMAQVARLPAVERDAIAAVIGGRQSVASAASQLGVSEKVLLARVVRGLRRLGDLDGGGPLDARIGIYLLEDGPTFDRDDAMTNLHDAGVDFLEIHELEVEFARLNRIPQRAWATLDPSVV